MATPATALIPDSGDKKRTTVTLPAQLLAEAEAIANKKNTTVSAIIAQAMEAGMASLQRKERAQAAYTHMRTALAGLTEEEGLLVDGIHLTPNE